MTTGHRLVAGRVHGIRELPGAEVNDPGFHLSELLLNGARFIEHARGCEDIAFAIQGLVCFLCRLEHDRGGRDHHGADDTERKGNQQGLTDAVILRHGQASV